MKLVQIGICSLILVSHLANAAGKGPNSFINQYSLSRKSKKFETSCLGSKNADHYIIYLHGMDTKSISPGERSARRELQLLAEKMNARIALPRADQKCPDSIIGEYCWTWGSSENLEETLDKILEARTQCFPEDVRYGIVGFSNGGYFLSRWFQLGCQSNHLHKSPDWVIASGAAGLTRNAPHPDFSSHHCPSMRYLIGKDDRENRDDQFLKSLVELGAPMQPVLEFSGAHELDYRALKDAILQF